MGFCRFARITGPAGCKRTPMGDSILPINGSGTIANSSGTINYNYLRIDRLVHFQGTYSPPNSAVSWSDWWSFKRFTLPSEFGYVDHSAEYSNTMILHVVMEKNIHCWYLHEITKFTLKILFIIYGKKLFLLVSIRTSLI